MIVANLATYPPRSAFLPVVLRAVSPQVDRLNLVLNEHDAVPDFVEEFQNVVPILPEHDTKDAGKFYPDTTGAEFVFFVDDDVVYPDDFVATTLARMAALGEGRWFGGYHGSIYQRPWPGANWKQIKRMAGFHLFPHRLANYRRFIHFGMTVSEPVYVDQIATNASIIRGSDAPPYDYMRSSQKFVDVRIAKWCHEQGIARVSLPRDADWLAPSRAVGVVFEETIIRGFTDKHHAHVAREIREFAFREPRVGQPVRQPAQ